MAGLWTYECEHCRSRFDVEGMPTHPQCPSCSGFETFIPNGSAKVSIGTYQKPLISDALAVPVHQIDEHKQQFPEIDLTPGGQPIFTNRKQHDAYLDKINMVKNPQKTKKLGRETIKIDKD